MDETTEKNHGSGKTGLQSKGITASYTSGPRLYFHPDSETLLVAEGDELEQESNWLNQLLARQIDSQLRIDDLTRQCTALDWEQVAQRNTLQTALQKEIQQLDALNKQLKTELAVLSPTEALPKVALLDSKSKSAVGLMELIEVKGGASGAKYTYVRSDKIKNHWRRYSLNDGDKKTGNKSFITREHYTDAQGKPRSREKIDVDKLKSQLAKVKPKMLKAEQPLIEERSVILGQWAKDMNESLKTSPYEGEQFGFDSQSQLMRWTYGAGLSEELNPFEWDLRSKKKKTKKKGELSGKLSAYAGLALAESKSKLTLSLPDKKGIKLCYPLRPEAGGGLGELGTLRFDFEIMLSGSIGASLGVELGVSMKSDWAKGIPGSVASAEIPGQRKIDITKVVEEPEVKGELSVFAGAQATVNLSGALLWWNPEQKDKDKYTTLAKVAVGVSLQAGVGWSGTFQFRYENGRVRVMVRAGLCWGSGGKGSTAFDINGRAIMTEFMPCLTYMLRNADYIRLADSVIRKGDFYAFCALPLLIGMYGLNQAFNKLESETDDLLDALRDSWFSKEKRVALMEDILNTQGECLKHSPPESKGAAIASLIEHNFWDEFASPASHAQTTCEGTVTFSARKRAILFALRWVQSKRDYENIMQHLSMDFKATGTWQQNQQKVVDFLAQGEAPQTYGAGAWVPNARVVKILPSHYAQNLADIYRSLPDTADIRGDERQPLKPVSDQLMRSCTRVITEQPGK